MQTSKQKWLAPSFSFLLPGLGQLYQGRPFLASGLFTAFTVASLVPGVRLIIPLVALGASLDAFWRDKSNATELPEHPLVKTLAYSVVGFVGFFGWMGLVSPAFLPVGTQMDINDQVYGLAAEVRACRKNEGFYPRALEQCLASRHSKISTLDPWGSPYVYTFQSDAFQLRSAGKDRKLGTADDYVYHLR